MNTSDALNIAMDNYRAASNAYEVNRTKANAALLDVAIEARRKAFAAHMTISKVAA